MGERKMKRGVGIGAEIDEERSVVRVRGYR